MVQSGGVVMEVVTAVVVVDKYWRLLRRESGSGFGGRAGGAGTGAGGRADIGAGGRAGTGTGPGEPGIGTDGRAGTGTGDNGFGTAGSTVRS